MGEAGDDKGFIRCGDLAMQMDFSEKAELLYKRAGYIGLKHFAQQKSDEEKKRLKEQVKELMKTRKSELLKLIHCQEKEIDL